MTENYTVRKKIDRIGLDMEMTVKDRDLMVKIDDAIMNVIIEHFGLEGRRL